MDLGRIYPHKLTQVSYLIHSIPQNKKSTMAQETWSNWNVRALNTPRNTQVKGILRESSLQQTILRCIHREREREMGWLLIFLSKILIDINPTNCLSF